jgi:hypothetical protein
MSGGSVTQNVIAIKAIGKDNSLASPFAGSYLDRMAQSRIDTLAVANSGGSAVVGSYLDRIFSGAVTGYANTSGVVNLALGNGVFGAYSELWAASPISIKQVILMFYTFGGGVPSEPWDIQFSTGAAGAEVPQYTLILSSLWTKVSMQMLTIPLIIASGVRIAMNGRAGAAGQTARLQIILGG